MLLERAGRACAASESRLSHSTTPTGGIFFHFPPSSNPILRSSLGLGRPTYIFTHLVSTNGMHKDELLQLHSLLCQVKRFMEDANLPTTTEFGEYDNLNVSPQHIHKSKTDHKRAVFLLGKGLSEVVMLGNKDQMQRLRDRFLRLATGEPAAPAVQEEVPAPQATEPRQRDQNLPEFALAALSG